MHIKAGDPFFKDEIEHYTDGSENSAEFHELHSGCGERQFKTCSTCLFNGNTEETRTTWCMQPSGRGYCYESVSNIIYVKYN